MEQLTACMLFNEFVNSLNFEIEKEKKNQTLKKLSDDPGKWESNKLYWTPIIKRCFKGMGEMRGFKVWTNLDEIEDANKGEYLLDLAWVDENSEKLILGLESEWGNWEAVEYDFYKLMYTKSKIKVTVFKVGSDMSADSFITDFQKTLKLFEQHIPGEQYLFIEFCEYEPYRIIGYDFTITEDVIGNSAFYNGLKFKLNKLEKEIYYNDKIKNYKIS